MCDGNTRLMMVALMFPLALSNVLRIWRKMKTENRLLENGSLEWHFTMRILMAKKLFRRRYRILLQHNMGRRRASQVYSDRIILLVYLWSVINDRRRSRAGESQNAPDDWPFVRLPDESTLSRRMRTRSIVRLLEQIVRVLDGSPTERFWYNIDANPLSVCESTKVPEARVGRGAGKMHKGYMLYTIIDDQNQVVTLRLAPLNVDEKKLAFRMLRDQPAQVGDRDDEVSIQPVRHRAVPHS